ncbi:matrixin family metalloprotease [Nannocystis pusilla]|uniref:matrixin family metalloprotease n=1 Tax=Nannocystis pusilla TaxID=889268 RepID=UPI0030B7F9A5
MVLRRRGQGGRRAAQQGRPRLDHEPRLRLVFEQFSVKAVMTHERGHTFGLGHVGESSHGDLTMSPTINGPCQDSESTLGEGDVAGLRALY